MMKSCLWITEFRVSVCFDISSIVGTALYFSHGSTLKVPEVSRLFTGLYYLFSARNPLDICSRVLCF